MLLWFYDDLIDYLHIICGLIIWENYILAISDTINVLCIDHGK